MLNSFDSSITTVERFNSIQLPVKLSLNSGYPCHTIIDCQSLTIDNSPLLLSAKADCYFQLYGDNLTIENQRDKFSFPIEFGPSDQKDLDKLKYIWSGDDCIIYKQKMIKDSSKESNIVMLQSSLNMKTLVTIPNSYHRIGVLWIYIESHVIPVYLEEVKVL